MKLFSLNIWGGHVFDPLMNFVNQHKNTDIFCLQEVYHRAKNMASDEDRTVCLDILDQLHQQLPQHTPYFRPVVNNSYGVAMLVRNTIEVIEEGEIPIYTNPTYSGIGPAHSRILQYLHCQSNGTQYLIVNIHGLWNGKGKLDSPDRIQQSTNIANFINKYTLPKIICGDFNLRPETQSLQMLETNLINLIKTHGITSTRTSFYPKPERFADYVLISPEITISKFAVLPDEVSDHSALYVALANDG